MAKEQKQEQNPGPGLDAVPEAAAPPKSYRLYAILGFVSLILFQMTVLWLILPPKESQPDIGIDVNDGTSNFSSVSPIPPAVIKKEDMTENQIGDKNSFKITNARDGENEKFSVSLIVQVRKQDQYYYNLRYQNCMNEIINNVSGILRASTTDERREANHTAIRERVKNEINLVLGTSWVQQVFFLDVVHEVN